MIPAATDIFFLAQHPFPFSSPRFGHSRSLSRASPRPAVAVSVSWWWRIREAPQTRSVCRASIAEVQPPREGQSSKLGELHRKLRSSCRKGRFAESVRFFEELGKYNARIWPKILRYSDMHEIVTSCAKAGKTELALKALRIMESQLRFVRRSTYALVIKSLAEANLIEDAYSLIRELFIKAETSHKEDSRFFRPDTKMILHAAACAVKADRQNLAGKLIELMREYDLKPCIHQYSIMITRYGRLQKPGMIIKALRRMKTEGVDPDDVFFGTVIQAFVACGDTEKAVTCLRSIPEPNAQHYNILLHHLVCNDDTRTVNELLREMRTRGIRQTTVTRNIIIQWLTKRGDIARALQYLRTDRNFNRDDMVAYTTIISALAAHEEVPRARSLLDKLEDEILNRADPKLIEELAVAFTSLISYLMKNREFAEAWHLYEGMIQKGIEPVLETYSTMISGLCAANDFLGLKSAERVFLRIHKQIARWDSAAEGILESYDLTHAYSGRPDDDQGRSVMEVRRRNPWQSLGSSARGNPRLISVYNSMLSGYAGAGIIEKAESLFRWMRKEGPTPDCTTYSSMMRAYNRVGDFESCRKVFFAMRKAGVQPKAITMNILISACVSAKEIELGVRLFEEMVQTRGIITPDELTYRCIIEGLCSVGNVERAWNVYQKMKSAGIRPDKAVLSLMMNGLMKSKETADTESNKEGKLASRTPRHTEWINESKFELLKDLDLIGVEKRS